MTLITLAEVRRKRTVMVRCDCGRSLYRSYKVKAVTCPYCGAKDQMQRLRDDYYKRMNEVKLCKQA
jgi:hypothetical protein